MVNRLCKVKRAAMAAAISFGWCVPAIAQSVFVDPGESAFMVAGAVLDVHGGEPAWLGTIAGSVHGKVDLFLSVGSMNRKSSGTAGISRLLNRSRVLSGSIGAGVTIGKSDTGVGNVPEVLVAPFLSFALNSILERGRWRLIPEVGATGALSIGTGDVPVVGAGLGLAVQRRLSPPVAVVLSAEYVIADRLENAGRFGVDSAYEAVHGVAGSLGLVVSFGARPQIELDQLPPD